MLLQNSKRLYALSWTDSQRLILFDVSNITNPKTIHNISFSNVSAVNMVSSDGRTLYVVHSDVTTVWNITDYENPTYVVMNQGTCDTTKLTSLGSQQITTFKNRQDVLLLISYSSAYVVNSATFEIIYTISVKSYINSVYFLFDDTSFYAATETGIFLYEFESLFPVLVGFLPRASTLSFI